LGDGYNGVVLLDGEQSAECGEFPPPKPAERSYFRLGNLGEIGDMTRLAFARTRSHCTLCRGCEKVSPLISQTWLSVSDAG
jgi:hypothetical protein